MTVINTPEEAHLLPVGTIISLVNYRCAAIKLGKDYWDYTGCDAGGQLMPTDFPAIVVFTPEAE